MVFHYYTRCTLTIICWHLGDDQMLTCGQYVYVYVYEEEREEENIEYEYVYEEEKRRRGGTGVAGEGRYEREAGAA